MKKFTILFLILLAIPAVVLAFGTNCDPGSTGSTLCNPNPSTDLTSFFSKTIEFVGTLIGLMAIAMLVYAGVRILMANGDPTKIGEAKKSLTYTIAGFVISVMAYAGILAVENFIGVRNIDYSSPTTGITNPLSSGTLQGFVESIIQNVLKLSGLVALFMIILNGFRYLSARGDDQQVTKAKTGLTWSVIGLALILFAYVIINALAKLVS